MCNLIKTTYFMSFVCGNKISWFSFSYRRIGIQKSSNQLINQECKILCAIMTSTWACLSLQCWIWKMYRQGEFKMMCKTFLIPHIILPCSSWYAPVCLSRIRVYKHKIIYFYFCENLIHTKIIFQISYFYVFYVHSYRTQ